MRVYFLSCTAAALKLNGLYVGTIDGFERHIELDKTDGILAEIVPGENLQPVNFFLDEKFFKNPPQFADVYLFDGDALVYIREYARKDVAVKVIYQTRFSGNLITVFYQGNVYLSIDASDYNLITLPYSFLSCTAEAKTLNGFDVLALYGGNRLVLISSYGKVIYSNVAENAEFTNVLKLSAPFETCNSARADCTFSYDGEKLSLISSVTVQTRPPEKEILHFAFFESVLTCGDYSSYLSDELKPRAAELKSYLGNFVAVTIPPEKFYLLHGEKNAAGLAYPLAENLFEIKYFTVDLENGKVCNIRPVE